MVELQKTSQSNISDKSVPQKTAVHQNQKHYQCNRPLVGVFWPVFQPVTAMQPDTLEKVWKTQATDSQISYVP